MHRLGSGGFSYEFSDLQISVLASPSFRMEVIAVIPVNEHFQTNIENIYAAGDVIGFPALASTSIEQARRAV